MRFRSGFAMLAAGLVVVAAVTAGAMGWVAPSAAGCAKTPCGSTSAPLAHGAHPAQAPEPSCVNSAACGGGAVGTGAGLLLIGFMAAALATGDAPPRRVRRARPASSRLPAGAVAGLLRPPQFA